MTKMHTKNTLIRHIRQSWKTFMRDKLLIPLYAVLDLAFVSLFLYTLTTFSQKIMPILKEVTTVTRNNLQAIKNITGDSSMAEPAIARQEAVMQQMDEIFKLTLLLLLSLYLLWTVLQGVNLSLVAHRIRKASFPRAFGAFSLYSIGAMLILLLIFAAYARFAVFNEMVLGMFSQGTIAIVFLAIFIIVGYFLYCGFSLIGGVPLKHLPRRQFTEPIHHFKLLSGKYLLSLCSLLVANALFLIIFYLFETSMLVFLSLIFFVLVVLPLVAYLRYLQLYSKTSH